MKMKQTLALLACMCLLFGCSTDHRTPPSPPPVVTPPPPLDTTPPVITLFGDNPQVVTTGTAYIELGATATDDVDGDLSGSIVIDANAVDISTAGSYSVTYDVTDSSGNTAHTMVRTVTVEDPPPVPSNPGGLWIGTIRLPGVVGGLFQGLLTETGEGRFQDIRGIWYIVDNVSGYDNNITINFTAIAPPARPFDDRDPDEDPLARAIVFADGSTVTTGTVTGTLVDFRGVILSDGSWCGDCYPFAPHTALGHIDGAISLASGESGTIYLGYRILYDRDSSLAKLEGSWEVQTQWPDKPYRASATFDPDGSFFWQDPFGCVYDGQASIIDPDYNAYALDMTISLCGSAADGQYSGQGVLTYRPGFDDHDEQFQLWMNSDTRIYTVYLRRWQL